MYHYHTKTHDPIPSEQLCDHGCGSPAQFRGTGGVYSCVKNSFTCFAYLQQHSARVKTHWERPEATERREQTKKILLKTACTPEAIDKMKETKRKKSGLLTPQDAKNYRHYARAIRQRAQIWAKEQGYEIGRQTYHVDHKLSILDAWNANLPAEIVNHPVNLQILEATANTSKGAKSTITVEELLNLLCNSADQSN